MEVMFNEMDQATTLSIHLYAEHEFYPGENDLQASIDCLMSKHFGSTKILDIKNQQLKMMLQKECQFTAQKKNSQQGRRMNELIDY